MMVVLGRVYIKPGGRGGMWDRGSQVGPEFLGSGKENWNGNCQTKICKFGFLWKIFHGLWFYFSDVAEQRLYTN